MQRTHIIIFLLFIFVSFLGISPSPIVPELNTQDEKSFSYEKFSKTSRLILMDWSTIANKSLQKECGSCHQSSRVSDTNTALHVFDLDQKDWMAHTDRDILRSISQRVDDELFVEEEIQAIQNLTEYYLASQLD